MLANRDRNPKNKKTPYSLEDFYLYQPKSDRNLPAGRFGAAAKELIKQGQFPSWALFCYKDLAINSDAPLPSRLAYTGDDFIVLAPIRRDGVVKGLLIALESASGQIREALSPDGDKVFLHLPNIPTKVIAEEDVELQIV